MITSKDITVGSSIKGLVTGSLQSAGHLAEASGRVASTLNYTMASIENMAIENFITGRTSVAKTYKASLDELTTIGYESEQASSWLSL